MRLSRNLRRCRWLVFTGWLLALVPAVYLAMTQSGNLTGGGFEVAGSQSLLVHDQLDAHYPDRGAPALALVAAPRPDASYQDIDNAVALLRQIASELPGVTEAPNPTQRPPQPDRPYVVSLRLDARNAGTSDVAKKLRDRIGVKGDQSGQTANGKVRLYVIGQGALSAAAAANTKHDIANAERWNLPIILMVLVAVFGSLAAAAIPLALAVCTVVITMGLVFVLSMHTTMSVFVTSTVSMFGIALAVDYSLFILMRYREELRCGRRPPDAVDAAMATSGLAVVLSGMTVIASLTGIYLINTPALRSMATGAILAVAVAMLTSATLTPAVLATFARAAANYIYDDSSSPTDLCSGPLRHCGSGDLYGGNEPSRTWFAAMKPIANNFGEVQLPPTDPRYVDGAPGSRVPSVAGLDVDAARQRLKDAGFQVADQTNSVNSSAKYGEVVGTSPSGQTIPGSIVTIQISNGIPPAPPPPPLPEDGGPPPPVGSQVVEIPGLPPITIPLLAPPPPAPPP